MGQITTGTGLISGLDIQGIVDQLIAIESRPRQIITQRNTVLQAQQAAFQDINAKLFSLDFAIDTLTKESTYQSTRATSSNENVITATSGNTATAGSYQFTVDKLVSSQQLITQGFKDADNTPVGAGTLTFEFGDARLDSNTDLRTLNGGEGINRGRILIGDRSGATQLIDLSRAVTVDDVLDEINNAVSINVTASVEGDQLVITDTTGATTANLSISDVGTTGTATSLGIAGSVAATSLTGTQINTLGNATQLADLRDGKGIGVKDGVNDFFVNDGAINFNVNLDGASTLGDVIDTINAAATTAGAAVTASVSDDGVGLKLDGAATVTALNDSNAASNLGILTLDGSGNGGRLVASLNSKLINGISGGAGFENVLVDRSVLDADSPFADLFNGAGITTSGTPVADVDIRLSNGQQFIYDFDSYTTVGDFIDDVNNNSGGAISAAINADNTLTLTDNSGGGLNFRVFNLGTATVADELGISGSYPSTTITSSDLNPVPTEQTLSGVGSVTFTDRSGATESIDFSAVESISEALDLINNAATVSFTASLNNAGNGIKLTDTSGGSGDITIGDDSGAFAAAFGINGTFSGTNTIEGRDVDFGYVDTSTLLSSLNGGQGVSSGSFVITDSSGQSATVDLSQGNETTIQSVLDEINSRGLDINARVNDTGDGIIIEDLGPGTVALTVEESGSTTAADLGILGSAANAGDDLDGSYEKTITISDTDTLSDVAKLINDAGFDVAATVINDGSSANPFRLSLASTNAGSDGAFLFDDGGIGLSTTTLAEAQDAVVFFGGSDPASAITITSASNTLDSVIPGATINLVSSSDAPVEVNVSRSNTSITTAVKKFVTDFNTLMSTIESLDSYDAETEERGLLLGDSTLARVRSSLFRVVINRNGDLTSQYNTLSSVGITVGTGATLELDEAKFTQALSNNREAVEALFTFKETEEDADGDDVTTARGIGVAIQEVLDRLTDSTNGTMQLKIDSISRQVEFNNERVEDFDLRLAAKRAQFEAEFAAMERSLALLQDQSAALQSLQSLQ